MMGSQIYQVDLEKQERNYLFNYWKPAAGNTVKVNGQELSITEIIETNQDQCTLSDGSICFLQDAEWVITESDIKKLLLDMGVLDCGAQFQFMNTFFEWPNTIEDAGRTVRTMRFFTQQEGKDLFFDYWGMKKTNAP